MAYANPFRRLAAGRSSTSGSGEARSARDDAEASVAGGAATPAQPDLGDAGRVRGRACDTHATHYGARDQGAPIILDRKSPGAEIVSAGEKVVVCVYAGAKSPVAIALSTLMRAGFGTQTVCGPDQALVKARNGAPTCLVVCVKSLGAVEKAVPSLPALCREIPVLVVTREADVRNAVELMKGGVRDVLVLPLRPEHLAASIRQSLAGHGLAAKAATDPAVPLRAGAAEGRTNPAVGAPGWSPVDQLTLREREVLSLLVDGWSNKDIARHLGISFRTVEIHRGRVMQKMGARNIFNLVAAYVAAGSGAPALPSSAIEGTAEENSPASK